MKWSRLNQGRRRGNRNSSSSKKFIFRKVKVKNQKIRSTILDKTVEKIAYLGGIFSKLRSRPILPSPPPPGSSVVGSSKESRIPKHLQDATLNWGRGGGGLYAKPLIWKQFCCVRQCALMKTFSQVVLSRTVAIRYSVNIAWGKSHPHQSSI